MSRYADLFRFMESPDRALGKIVPGETESAVSGPFTLLFVDDEENVLRALKRVFMEEDYHILTATSGQTALQLMEAEPVHLVMSDYKMPGMNGAELLKEIRRKFPESIRIMLTGNADIQAIMGAVNEGAVYKFITKPWSDDDLRITVSIALDQYRLVRENQALKECAKNQQEKVSTYARLFEEYRGILPSILVSEGILTKEEQLTAQKEQQKDELIVDTLVRLNLASEAKMVLAIKKHQNLQSVDLKEININPNIARFFPYEFCERNRLIPTRIEGKTLSLAMADPTDIIKLDNISMLTGFKVVPLVSKSSDILAQIRKTYGINEGEEAARSINEAIEYEPMEEIDIVIDDDESVVNVQELINSSGVPPIVRIVNATILEALRYKASDIHIEPKTKHTLVRYRIDGMLHSKLKIPSNLHPAVTSRIKILAKLDISERRKPQDGRLTIKTGTRIVDVRVSTMPTIIGEKIVMRILDKNGAIKRLSELGISTEALQRLDVIIKKPQGIVIATGPTGSGKTTLLYSILYEMLQPTRNFETIEDPIEYFLEDASQIYVREQIGLSFASVLRAMLRQDPDVLLVGEIRDHETADVAFKAALTGHMVLTTLHTNNTVASVTRLIDIGIKPYLIASATEGIVAQRLVRKICPHCCTSGPAQTDILNLLKIPAGTLTEVAYGKGCQHCNNTGYHGRIGIFEVFVVNDDLRHRINTDYKEADVMKAALADGMKSLMEDGVEKVRGGVTTLQELLRVLGPPTRHERNCERCGKLIDVKFLFCPYCGAVKLNACPRCRLPLEDDWSICPACGTRRTGPGDTNSPAARSEDLLLTARTVGTHS